jgi:hypothetical protein
VSDVAFSHEYCATLSATKQLLQVHKITDLQCGVSKLLNEVSVDIDSASKVAIDWNEDHSELKVAVSSCSNDIVLLKEGLKVDKILLNPHNGQTIS